MSTRRLLAAGLLLVSTACHAPEPAYRPVEPVTAEMLERFRLEHDRSEAALSTLAILGTPAPAGGRERGPQGDPAADVDAPSAGSEPLLLDALLRSVERRFPLIAAALEEVEIAAAGVEAAEGAFDTKLSAKNSLGLDGYYENDRYDIGLEQPTTLYGATVSAGWRLGQGDFASYDGKAKTNGDGEFRLGVSVPLLQGGAIDPRRVAMWTARIDEQRAQPLILEKRLAATAKAASAYWTWVARGAKRTIAQQLLALAEQRTGQLEDAVEQGLLPAINLTDNRRSIVERRSLLVRAERALTEAAIQLSLFWRDDAGQPLVPGAEQLPDHFPAPRDPAELLRDDDLHQAATRRPEVLLRRLEIEALEVELELAGNQRLAELDIGLLASQDIGSAANSPDDKDPFELQALVGFRLPLQRRKALGTERKVLAKRAKLQQELRYAQDLVVSEVRDVSSELEQGWERIGQARENVSLAGELEQAERLRLEYGESDLFRVNLREQQTASAASALVDVMADHFKAQAAYRAALGLPYDEVLAGHAIGGGTDDSSSTRAPGGDAGR